MAPVLAIRNVCPQLSRKIHKQAAVWLLPSPHQPHCHLFDLPDLHPAPITCPGYREQQQTTSTNNNMFANFPFFAALCLVLGLQALALRITSPGRDAQWKKGNRETVSWEVG